MPAIIDLMDDPVAPPPILEPEHYEVIDGQVVETPRMGVKATWIASILDQTLGPYARANRLGRVVTKMMFALGEGRNKRRPDLAFVAYDRWARDRQVPDGAAWDGVPNLAIEVVSPSKTYGEIATKRSDYFAAGVEAVWVVIPETSEVQMWESPRLCRALHPGDEIEGVVIFPGFRMPVAALFDETHGD